MQWKQFSGSSLQNTSIDYPTARHGHILHSISNKLVSMWGGDHGVIDQVYSFSIPDLEWEQIVSEQPPAAGCASTTYNGIIYIFGGVQECSKDDVFSNALIQFDPSSNLFTTLSSSTGSIRKPTRQSHTTNRNGPSARIGSTLTYVPMEHALYLFGGLSQKCEVLSDMYRFDLHTKEWDIIETTGVRPIERESHSAVYVKKSNKIVVYGGFRIGKTGNCDRLGDVLYFDIKSRCWSSPKIGGNIPSGRALHSAVLYKDLMYVYGGWVTNLLSASSWVCSSEILCFNTSTHTWSSVRTPKYSPQARSGHAATLVGDCMFVFGGNLGPVSSENTQLCSDELWGFQLDSNYIPEKPFNLQIDFLMVDGKYCIKLKWDHDFNTGKFIVKLKNLTVPNSDWNEVYAGFNCFVELHYKDSFDKAVLDPKVEYAVAIYVEDERVFSGKKILSDAEMGKISNLASFQSQLAKRIPLPKSPSPPKAVSGHASIPVEHKKGELISDGRTIVTDRIKMKKKDKYVELSWSQPFHRLSVRRFTAEATTGFDWTTLQDRVLEVVKSEESVHIVNLYNVTLEAVFGKYLINSPLFKLQFGISPEEGKINENTVSEWYLFKPTPSKPSNSLAMGDQHQQSQLKEEYNITKQDSSISHAMDNPLGVESKREEDDEEEEVEEEVEEEEVESGIVEAIINTSKSDELDMCKIEDKVSGMLETIPDPNRTLPESEPLIMTLPKKRGRKKAVDIANPVQIKPTIPDPTPKKRGRPKKKAGLDEDFHLGPKKRGKPKKQTNVSDSEDSSPFRDDEATVELVDTFMPELSEVTVSMTDAVPIIGEPLEDPILFQTEESNQANPIDNVLPPKPAKRRGRPKKRLSESDSIKVNQSPSHNKRMKMKMDEEDEEEFQAVLDNMAKESKLTPVADKEPRMLTEREAQYTNPDMTSDAPFPLNHLFGTLIEVLVDNVWCPAFIAFYTYSKLTNSWHMLIGLHSLPKKHNQLLNLSKEDDLNRIRPYNEGNTSMDGSLKLDNFSAMVGKAGLDRNQKLEATNGAIIIIPENKL